MELLFWVHIKERLEDYSRVEGREFNHLAKSSHSE